MKAKLRKDDLVEVIAGNDYNRPSSGRPPTRGRIVAVDRKRHMVTVEGVNTRVFHTRVQQTDQGKTGGIEEREAPIHASNVMLVDPKTDKPVRVGITEDENGRRVRYTKGKNASGSILDDQA